MRSRALRIAILLFQALWFGVLVPGHRRGMIALPGEQNFSELSQARSCCRVEKSKSKGAPQIPCSRDPAQHCAICHLAMRLSTPPVIDIILPPCGLAEVLTPSSSDLPAA